MILVHDARLIINQRRCKLGKPTKNIALHTTSNVSRWKLISSRRSLALDCQGPGTIMLHRIPLHVHELRRFA